MPLVGNLNHITFQGVFIAFIYFLNCFFLFVLTAFSVRNFLIYTMNDCDSKKLNYTLRVYRQDSKHRYTYGWFEIIGRNGKREKVNII